MSDCQLSSQSPAHIRQLEEQSYQFMTPKNQINQDQPPYNSFITHDLRILTTQRDLLIKKSSPNPIPIQNTLDHIMKRLLISRIIKNWRTYAQNIQLETVHLHHLKLINDLAYDFTTYQYKQNAIVQIITNFQNKQLNNSYYTKFNSKLKHYYTDILYFIQILPVINPTNSSIIVIDIIVLVITLILSLIIPVNLAFRDLKDFTQDTVYIIDKCLSYLLLIEILFKFNVGFYQNGQIIMNRMMIFKNYIKSILLFDLLTIIINIITTNAFSLIFLIRQIIQIFCSILNLDHYFFKLIFIFRVKNTIVNIMNFFRLCYIIIFISNSIGCLWYIITKNDPNSSLNESEDQGFYNLYIDSLYWAVTTMLSVGYGDQVAKNNIQRLFSILTMFTGCGLFAYIMNQIGQLISQINAQQNLSQRNSIQIEKYINQKPITDSLKEKIRLMSKNKMNQRYQIAQFGQSLLGSIPNELLDDYRNQVQLQFIHNSPVFHIGFTQKFQYLLSRKLKSLIVLTEENINQDCLYFVESGSIVQKFHDIEFVIAKQNDLLFDVQFFSGFLDQNCYQAKTLSTLFSINREEMRVLLLETYDQSFERFHYIKDSLNLYSNYSILNKLCNICHSKHHLLANCNQIHLVLNKNTVIKKFLKQSSQLRRYFGGRNNIKQFQTRKQLQNIQIAAIFYLENIQLKREEKVNNIVKQEELIDPTSICFNHLLNIPNIELLQTKNPISQKPMTSRKSVCNLQSQKEIYESFQFDKYHTFNSYFPHNNILVVLDQYQQNYFKQKATEFVQLQNIKLSNVLELNT